MLFKLVDALGYRLPVVRTELLGTVNYAGATGGGRITIRTIIATIINIATITTANVVARNLGVGADGKQPIIATTRSDRIVATVSAATHPGPIARWCRRRRCQGRIRGRPVLKT